MGAIDIAVIRALHLGDLLCTIPAIRALRLAGPRSRIVLIGLPWAGDFCARYPHYFDGFLPFPGWPGIPEGDRGDQAIRALREFHGAIPRPFDLLLQIHGDGTYMNDFAGTIPARVRGGFVPADAAEVPALHTRYPEALPEPLRVLSATVPLGVESEDASLELPVFDLDRREARALLAAAGAANQPYAVVHPGGRGDDRRWPVDGFASVVDALHARGLRVVVTGVSAERPIADALAAKVSGSRAFIDLVGRTSLGTMAALVDEAQVVVTNDTGTSHIAAARQTPSVVTFVGSDPARWAPLDRERHVPVGTGAQGAPLPAAVEVIGAALALVGAAA